MNIILLSGGSGKRLWPLSNDVRSKQFIKIFKKDDNTYESMVQRMHRGIRSVNVDANITIATSKTQVSSIYNQLGDDVWISVEPCRRDTFPAIILATAYLHDVQGIDFDEVVVVCPVDPYMEDDYFKALEKLGRQTEHSNANLVLMGIEPAYPSDKYGYIIPKDQSVVSNVMIFKEKPDEKTAAEYIAKGALWNSGVFAYKLRYLLDKAHELIDFIDYEDLFSKYETLAKISFDYAVVEKETKIEVMRFNGTWKDLGTWNTFTEAMDGDSIGSVYIDKSCKGSHVINELDVPIVCMGLKDIVVAASPQGVLVSDKAKTSEIKPIVDKIDQQVMFAEKSWGTFKVIDVENDSITIKVTMEAGDHMNYHSHQRRDEIWNIISGTGHVIIDGIVQSVKPGDVVTMAAGSRHTIFAESDLEIIEVQIGKEISVYDKNKYELEV